MHQELRNYINKYASTEVTDDDFELIKEKFIAKHFRKNQYLLQEGEVSKHAIFVVKGALRQYSVDQKGVEHIVNLCTENWWVGDRESFTMLTPSKYNIEAVEDADVLLLTKAGFGELVDTVPIFVTVLSAMDYNYQIASQERINSAISFSAEERYLNLVATNPALIQRFPQTMIASFLGVSPETISRIRNKAH
ncbi:Crp/Fnr family transcriptional regulator [Dyadobacter arcticus]|uniref:CRP-like cAMP-binding protein n=1 Tax=Dyadobacter arcticus TaxID=1078754 RepID=A0ABX0UNK6_9BACT|nr:Crp/Fnr family transcriptional regulator [Dyadobacter arcticus]NIJ54571.1 CRP-like cAMP-binding protein [Dyadobacter arcticus]